jgi:hypothetical protein
MNPQPDTSVGTTFAIAFVALVAYHFIKTYRAGNFTPLSDMVNIGYVESPPPCSPVIINQTIPQQDQPNNNLESQQLYIDCIDTLVSIGFKKREARNKVKRIFANNPHISTVQEFLTLALQP